VHWKAIAARNAGAKALLVVAREEKFKEDDSPIGITTTVPAKPD